MKWNKYKPYLIWIGIVEAVGALSGFISRNGMKLYGTAVAKPPLSPPGWVFGVVWPILYGLMGWASYLVAMGNGEKKRALVLYGIQLGLNFLWPILFFRFGLVLPALVLLAALLVTVLLTMRAFSEVSERAGDLLIPYTLWLSFDLYLNFGIFLLN